MTTANRTQGRMTTGIERVFRPMNDGLYREILLHWVHFIDENGNKTSSKLQRQIEGQLYRPLRENERRRSIHGEVEYQLPDGQKVILIALGMEYTDEQYARGVR